MTDLDSMHYGRTGKNHQGDTGAWTPDGTDEDDEATVPGDDDLWDDLDTL